MGAINGILMGVYAVVIHNPALQIEKHNWNIIFLISQTKTYNMLWVLKEPSHWDGSFEHPKHMFKLMGKKMIVFYSQKFCLAWPM